MLSLFLYWELPVIISWAWSWWLKEQEATSALSHIPHLEIGRCRERWTEQKREFHNKKKYIDEKGMGIFFITEEKGRHQNLVREKMTQNWKWKQNVNALSFIFEVSVLNSYLSFVTMTWYWCSGIYELEMIWVEHS